MSSGLDAQGNPVNQPTAGGQPSIAAQKYGDNIEELRRGYDNQFTETQRIVQQQQAAQQQLTALQKQNEILLGLVEQPGRANPAAPANRSSALDPIAEKLEISSDQLGRALVEALGPQLSQLAGSAVDQRVGPLLRGTAARQIVSSDNPNYAANEAAVAQFLAQNPSLNTKVQEALNNQDPQMAALALENAYLRWSASSTPAQPPVNGGTPPPSGAGQGQQQYTQATAERELQNRLDAMIGGGMPSRTIVGVEPNRGAALGKLLNEADQTGNYTQFLGEFLKDKVPEAHTR